MFSLLRAERSVIRFFLVAALCLFFSPNVSWGQDTEPSATEWHIGGTTVHADFVRLTEDGVVLRRLSDRKEAEVPLSRLDFADQLRALKLGKPDAFNKPLPKADTGVVEVGPIETMDVEAIRVSPFTPDMSLSKWADTVKEELEKGNLLVFWHALPPKMQADVDEIFAQAMQKVGPLRGHVQRVLKSVATVVREKKKFVFGHPMVAAQPEIKETLDPIWPPLAKFLTVLADDQLWDDSNFQKGNLSNWLTTMVATVGPAAKELGEAIDNNPQIKEKVEQLQAMAPQSPGSNGNVEFDPTKLEVKVVQESATDGTIEVAYPEQPTQKIAMVKVNGYWLPKDLVEKWDEQMGQAKQSLAQFDPQSLTMANFLLGGVAGQFGLMASAKTQAEFNEAVQALMELGGQMGGFAGPGGAGQGPGSGRGPAAGGGPGSRPGQPGFGGGGGQRPGQPGFGGGGGQRPGQPGFGGGGGQRPGQPGFGGQRPGQPGFGGGAGGQERPGQPGFGRPGQPGFGGGGTGGASSSD